MTDYIKYCATDSALGMGWGWLSVFITRTNFVQRGRLLLDESICRKKVSQSLPNDEKKILATLPNDEKNNSKIVIFFY